MLDEEDPGSSGMPAVVPGIERDASKTLVRDVLRACGTRQGST